MGNVCSMLRGVGILFLSFAAVFVGCAPAEKERPIWEDVKIGDLRPPSSQEGAMGKTLKMVNFSLHTFEIPVDKVSALEQALALLHEEPLKFTDYEAFSANAFFAGFGDLRLWPQVAGILHEAGAKKTETVGVLLLSGRSNDVDVGRLYDEQTLFYTGSGDSAGAVTIGPGRLSLRIKADKIAGSRGVCKVDAQPVFIPSKMRSAALFFSCCRFVVQMGPGDFVLVGPTEYVSGQMSLAGLFFGKGKPVPVIRTYLLVCTRIVD
ncbi:MAG: hypothetical protein ACYSR5_09845 [Planctomycetota bacterium]